MSFIQTLIERKLSTLMNASTTLSGFSFSPLSGALEMTGLKVAAERFAVPVLTVERIAATLSVKRALKQEIAFKTLRIERPIFSVMVRSDGLTNLSHAPWKSGGNSSEKSGWDFECDCIEISDAQLLFRHFGHENYQLAIDALTGTFQSSENDLLLDFTADACGRRDIPVELGGLHVKGRLTGAGGFKNIGASALELAATISSVSTIVAAEIGSTMLENLAFDLNLSVAMRLATLLSLPPDDMKFPIAIEADKPVELKMRSAIRDRHITIESIDLKTGAISVGKKKSGS